MSGEFLKFSLCSFCFFGFVLLALLQRVLESRKGKGKAEQGLFEARAFLAMGGFVSGRGEGAVDWVWGVGGSGGHGLSMHGT